MKGYPGLRKRGSIYCLDIRVRGRRHRESLNTTSFEVAKKLWRKRRSEVELGERVDQRSALEWLDLFVRHLGGTESAHNREVERINRTFLHDSGAATVRDISGTAAVEWLLAYGQRYGRHGSISARSRSKYAQHLSQFGVFLVKHRKQTGLRDNPFDELAFSSGEADRVYRRRHYRLEELLRLLAASTPYRSLVYLSAATTGLRRKELGSLRWEDLNLE
ncbi:MAG TPA: hypothetical protein DEA08_15345 [Planctomycetes bacterium]|nr:hypothetical protein [Planctomycetota bacterium]